MLKEDLPVIPDIGKPGRRLKDATYPRGLGAEFVTKEPSQLLGHVPDGLELATDDVADLLLVPLEILVCER